MIQIYPIEMVYIHMHIVQKRHRKGKEDKKKYKSSTSAICGKVVSIQISTPLEKIVLVWNLNNEF